MVSRDTLALCAVMFVSITKGDMATARSKFDLMVSNMATAFDFIPLCTFGRMSGS